MATLIPHNDVPIEMLIAMHSRNYPDLTDELHTIAADLRLTHEDAQKKIYQSIERYQMRQLHGLLKPKSMCS